MELLFDVYVTEIYIFHNFELMYILKKNLLRVLCLASQDLS